MTYRDPEKQKAFQRQWQREQRLKRREKVVEILGGCCAQCGYKKHIAALQLDHIEPILRNKNDVKTGYGCQQLYNRIARGIESTENLQLLCANCHAIKTFTEDKVKFGRYNTNVFKPK